MSMKVDIDIAAFAGNARRALERADELALAAMREVAADLSGEAKDRAPLREGFLTEAIRGEAGTENGRAVAVISVPSNSQAAPYAVKMHEEEYELGENSRAKQLRTGKTVGRKFISRAIDDNRDRIRKIIESKLKV
ncbi:hypothetical protein HF882_06825 [Victivallis vadensis]|uniref:HK97 gp10 family phage protein n=1 Tax=Victivallis vadensis TaxID=172901 RepID=A0A848B064_9BACT|nr:hypothetical protein [Victivallis vadensis]NMD86296.1 hypothetical protein [Victivallis vadensis]